MFIASRRRLLGAGNATELAERRHHDRDEDERQDRTPVPMLVPLVQNALVHKEQPPVTRRYAAKPCATRPRGANGPGFRRRMSGKAVRYFGGDRPGWMLETRTAGSRQRWIVNRLREAYFRTSECQGDRKMAPRARWSNRS